MAIGSEIYSGEVDHKGMPHGEGTYSRFDNECKMNIKEAGFMLEDGKAGLCKYFKMSGNKIFS